ncbi:MAG TPA: hypothetical protein VKP13_19075 [Nitrospira sp.]|nr:hypothetical protein [Nitrospira sp.]
MQHVRCHAAWITAGASLLFAVAVLIAQWPPFTATAQEQKRFEYRIIEVLPDTQNMQSKLNEFGANGWELVAVSMGNMTEPRLIFKK